MSKPYFRTWDGWWYATLRVGKKRVPKKLVKGPKNAATEKAAWATLTRLEAELCGKIPEPSRLSVAIVCDEFLEFSSGEHERRTYQWYRGYLQDFVDRYGKLTVAELKPFHVTTWLKDHPGWGPGGHRSAITAVKRAFSYAEEQGLIPATPLRKLKKPPSQSRDRILTPEERQEIFDTIKDQNFKDFVFALQETGSRPSEVARLQPENVDLTRGIWFFNKHKTKKKTGKPRIVYLTPAMVVLTERLLKQYSDGGPLFRGPRRGKPFTRNAIRCRFRRLRAKLPHLKHFISYTYRHSYATDALANGVGIAEVAELLGHKSADMVMQHYGHLAEKHQHMLNAARKAAGGDVQPSRANEVIQ